MPRGQASVTAVEAGIGVLMLLSLTLVFAVGVPGEPTPMAQNQLDAYADDAATVLANEQPRHADQTRLAEITASEERFEREFESVHHRVEEILPPNVFYRIETAHGTVGHPLPRDVRTGSTTVPTTNGAVTITVWYPA